MDADGIAAEVIFAGGQNGQPLPFAGIGSAATPRNPGVDAGSVDIAEELRAVGGHMWNAWLADFVQPAPERLLGVMQVPIWDVEAATAEVRWGREAGLRAVNFPAPRRDYAPYTDLRYEPFWAACEELGVPLLTHSGGGDKPLGGLEQEEMDGVTGDGDEYVINGRKWFTSGAADPRCRLIIIMGKTDVEAPRHRQQSMILVPVDTPGVTNVRDIPVFGRHDQHGHCEMVYENVRVPVSNLMSEEGSGFALAQARLGPGRIHHCMRAVGAAERALQLTVERSKERQVFGQPLSNQGMLQRDIAESRIAIEQARLLCQHAAKLIDDQGNKAAATMVSVAKVAVPHMALEVIDRAIQVHGGAGMSDDVPLAALYSWHRSLRILDGPDEVHLRTIAKAELSRAATLKPHAKVVR